jgi:hypothetical protein
MVNDKNDGISRTRNHFYNSFNRIRLNEKTRRSEHMKHMPTQELSNELKKRKGITSIKIESYEKIEVGGIIVDGPAVILINQEYLKIVE